MHDKSISEIYCCPSCGKQLYKLRIMNYPEERICNRCQEELVPTGFYDTDMTKEKLNGDTEKVFVYKNFLYKNPKFNLEKHEEYINYLKSPEFKLKAQAELQSVLNDMQQEREDRNKVKCPRCGSTQIQMVQRKWSWLTGFFTNKVDRVCVNCKHKW